MRTLASAIAVAFLLLLAEFLTVNPKAAALNDIMGVQPGTIHSMVQKVGCDEADELCEKGKEIVKSIKEAGFKKVNAQIQDEQVRVTSPSIDELQAVIAHLKKQDFELYYNGYANKTLWPLFHYRVDLAEAHVAARERLQRRY